VTWGTGEKPSRLIAMTDKGEETTSTSVVEVQPRDEGQRSAKLATINDFSVTLPLSYSRLLEYETCPLRYFQLRVVGMAVPAHPALIYGKALHLAVEKASELRYSLAYSLRFLGLPWCYIRSL